MPDGNNKIAIRSELLANMEEREVAIVLVANDGTKMAGVWSVAQLAQLIDELVKIEIEFANTTDTDTTPED